MTSHVIDSTFGGTRHHLRLADAAWVTLQACLNRQGAAHQTVAVTYVEDDEADELDDEVDVAWLALVLKEYAACHALLQGADADAADLVMCTAKQASPEERTALLAAFLAAGSGATFAVPTDSLLDADAAAGVDAASFCVRLGFRGDTLAFPVPAAEHELCRLYLDATAGLALGDAQDTAPFAGSSLAPCDVALLRGALLAEETQPSTAETLALLDKRVREAEGAGASHVVGHVLFNVVQGSDALFSGLVQSQACYDYLADRNVPKRERLVVRDGRPVTYGSRIERAHRELCPKWSAERRAAFVAAMRERHAAAPVVDTGLLSDPVADAFAALFKDADAEAAAPAAGAAGEREAEEPAELTLDERFARAVERAKTLPSGLSNDNKLLLYAYFKQAQEGDCTKPKPGMLDFAGKAKWQAWVNVKGTSSDDAKRQYADACDAFAA